MNQKKKQSSIYWASQTVSLVDVIESIRSHGIKNNEKIAESIISHFNKDNYLKEKIYGLLAQRLKISTKRLFESIKFEAIETYEFVKRKAGYSEQVPAIKINVSVNRDKLPALLSGYDLDENPASVPSIPELVEWINGKRSYFKSEIDIKNEKLRERALAKQRSALLSYRNKKGRPNKGYGSVEKRQAGVDAVISLAETIRERMQIRTEKGLSPTKGSEYVFLGLYRGTFTPKYVKVGYPLLSMKNSSGKINEAILSYAEKIIKAELGELSASFNASASIESQLKEIGKDENYRLASELDQAFDEFLKKISKFSPGASQVRVDYERKINALAVNATNAFRNGIIHSHNKNKSLILDMRKELLELKHFYFRGRKVKMLPGRNYKTIGDWLKG